MMETKTSVWDKPFVVNGTESKQKSQQYENVLVNVKANKLLSKNNWN